MSKAPYTFAVLSDANLTMYPSFVAPTTVGPRVTSAADLTEGKWYAMFTNACNKPTVIHAQYKGKTRRGYHEFAVCEDDYQAMPALAHEIFRRTRTFITRLGEGGDILHVYKFKSRKDKPVKPVSKSPYTTTSTCAKHGIKEGDKFVVVDGGNRNFKEGTIVTLIRDDGSNCPYFERPGQRWHEACYLWRLAPVTATGRMQASAPALQNIPKSVGVRPVVKEVSPYEDSDYATCARYGIKVWDKFKVINADNYSKVSVGDVVTLTEDDGSSVPYFVNDSTGETIVIRLYRLVPLVANQSNTSAPAATLSPIDQIKSEIDALNAQKQIKQEEIDKLTKDVATIGGEVDKLKQKVADSLKEYLPEPKKPIW